MTTQTEIRSALEAIRSAELQLTEAVTGFKASGATWQQVGEALGLSPSAAHHRFSAVGAGSVEEARAKRLARARTARQHSLAYQAAGTARDLGLSAAQAGAALDADARTVARLKPSVAGRVERRVVLMPSGSYQKRYFLTE